MESHICKGQDVDGSWSGCNAGLSCGVDGEGPHPCRGHCYWGQTPNGGGIGSPENILIYTIASTGHSNMVDNVFGLKEVCSYVMFPYVCCRDLKWSFNSWQKDWDSFKNVLIISWNLLNWFEAFETNSNVSCF